MKKEAKQLRLLMDSIQLLLSFTQSLNINKEGIERHGSNLSIVRKQLDKYQKQHDDKEYLSTLSPAEKQNLYSNANAFYECYQKLSKEMDFLDLSKHPNYVTRAISIIEDAYLLSLFAYDKLGIEVDQLSPRLAGIRADRFAVQEYQSQVQNLYFSMESFTNDYWQYYPNRPDLSVCDGNPVIGSIIHDVYLKLTLAHQWLGKEVERMNLEEMPVVKDIPVPTETVPALPEDKVDPPSGDVEEPIKEKE